MEYCIFIQYSTYIVILAVNIFELDSGQAVAFDQIRLDRYTKNCHGLTATKTNMVKQCVKLIKLKKTLLAFVPS